LYPAEHNIPFKRDAAKSIDILTVGKIKVIRRKTICNAVNTDSTVNFLVLNLAASYQVAAHAFAAAVCTN